MTPGTDSRPSRGVHVVLAVKTLEDAKTRLAGLFPARARTDLVLAMLRDTLTAASAAEPVTGWSVVTPDARVAEFVSALGGRVVAEPRLDHDATAEDRLNRALSSADELVRRTSGSDVLALQADLPALSAREVEQAYASAAPDDRSVVVDHTGTGTSALIARGRPRRLEPRFGADSALRHIDSGAKPLSGNWPGLRLDVDTEDDLRSALDLGVGDHTARVLNDLGFTPRASPRARR